MPPVLPRALQQMHDPFLTGPVVQRASQADVRRAEPQPLTPEEVQEAQAYGILPASPAMPPAVPTNVGHVSAVSPVELGKGSPPPAAVGPRPAARGPAVVPRVQLDPAAAPQSPLSQALAAQREKYNTQLDKMTATPDYSQLSRQMQQRSAQGMDDMYASVLAGIGPEAVQGMQQPLLKNALAARQPMKVEGGQIDENGQVMLDPSFQRNKVADQLRNRLAQIDALEVRMQSDAEKAALAHERNMVLLLMRQMGLQMNQQNQGASTYGFTPEGQRVVEDRQGNQYVINQDGSRTRYMGPSTPRTAYEKNVQTAMQGQGSLERINKLIDLTNQNPEAFGLGAAATSMLPDIAQQRVMPKVLTPEQMVARNYIQRQAAEEIHQIYGAALTMGEGHRAAQWAIGPRDSFESVIGKLTAARDWVSQNMSSQGVAAGVSADVRRNPNGPATPPAPPANVPPARGGGSLPPGWSVRER